MDMKISNPNVVLYIIWKLALIQSSMMLNWPHYGDHYGEITSWISIGCALDGIVGKNSGKGPK